MFNRHHALIFLTGAVILSVEVLASRILTPYFGVSLYIWAAILSTTFAFLAIGHFLGDRITYRFNRETVTYYFLGFGQLVRGAQVSSPVTIRTYFVLLSCLPDAATVQPTPD
jgi:hypothetical protein